MLDYLRRTPAVRDVVVSGGDVANMPWPRLEEFVTRLLEIDNIRDIRLATKALMGLPQHWLQDDVRAGVERVATHGPRARRVAGDPHPRQPRRVGDARWWPRRPGRCSTPACATCATRACCSRRERRPARAARPVLRAARRRADHALLLLHVRHDPERRALAGLGRGRAAAAARHHGLPARASRRRASSATCRSSASGGCTSSPSTTASAASPTGRRTTAPPSRPTDPEALTRTYAYYDPIHTLPRPARSGGAEHADDTMAEASRSAAASRAAPSSSSPPLA